MRSFTRDVCLIGGGGHVGLPLALTFADSGLRTVIYDINNATVKTIRSGQMPFAEEGGQEMLERVLAKGTLEVESTTDLMADCQFIILIVGTPVDEHLNPSFNAIHKALELCGSSLRNGQILILRSTVFPGISQHVQNFLDERGLDIAVSFCPERVAQGYSIQEFRRLPQIISAFEPKVLEKVKSLFRAFTPEFIEMSVMEAELCKLMTNSWRYIQFATVNQFYMIASQHGLDFDRILFGCRHNYPRMSGMPGPGFAAGPCLVKDTMQLAAFSQNNFVLGHAAMLINEGLPAHLIELAEHKFGIAGKRTGILGMAFKAESDDRRDSLSYKLSKLLALKSKGVLCSDPYVTTDANLVPMERVIEESEVIFIGTPHKMYRTLHLPPSKQVIDVWNCLPPQSHSDGKKGLA